MRIFQIVTIVAVCFQLVINCFAMQYKQTIDKDCTIKATFGPFEGMYFNEEEYSSYENLLKDLDYIKNISSETDPVLLISYQNWMYLYTGRPIATYTTYFEAIGENFFPNYYNRNPDKLPRYIYIVPEESSMLITVNNYQRFLEDFDNMFDYTEEQLSAGVLLTVNNYIYDYPESEET